MFRIVAESCAVIVTVVADALVTVIVVVVVTVVVMDVVIVEGSAFAEEGLGAGVSLLAIAALGVGTSLGRAVMLGVGRSVTAPGMFGVGASFPAAGVGRSDLIAGMFGVGTSFPAAAILGAAVSFPDPFSSPFCFPFLGDKADPIDPKRERGNSLMFASCESSGLECVKMK